MKAPKSLEKQMLRLQNGWNMLGNMFVFYWAYMQKTKSMLEECPFKMRTAGNLCGWYFIGATFGKKYVFVHFYVTIFMVFEYINNGKGSGKTTERRKQKVKKKTTALMKYMPKYEHRGHHLHIELVVEICSAILFILHASFYTHYSSFIVPLSVKQLIRSINIFVI